MNVTGGATGVITYFVLRTAADGTATTGATITDMDLQYVRTGAAPSAKVDATALAATDSAHADNKAIEIDGTDAPGLYRVDWPDAAFAAGVRQVVLSVKLASSFTEHQVVDIDSPVGAVASVTGAVGSVTGNVGGSVASVTGAVGSVTGAVGSVTGAVGSVTGAVGSVGADGITAASLATDAVNEIVAAHFAIASLTADGTTTYGEIVADGHAHHRGQVDKSGTAYEYLDTDDATVRYTLTITAASRTTA